MHVVVMTDAAYWLHTIAMLWLPASVVIIAGRERMHAK